MTIGIGSWTFPHAIAAYCSRTEQIGIGPIELVREAVRLGAGVVQIADNLDFESLGSELVDQLALLADQSGISVELGMRGIDAGKIERALWAAQRVGARIIRTLLPVPRSSIASITQRLAPFRDAFVSAGVRLAVETYELYTVDDYCELIDALGRDWSGICLDVTNALGAAENPIDYAERLRSRTINIHVKDFRFRRVDSGMGFVVEGSCAGAGQLDIGALLTLFRDAPEPISVILEHWPPHGGSLQAAVALEAGWAEEGVRYLRSVIDSLMCRRGGDAVS